jgi:hypothetical protein
MTDRWTDRLSEYLDDELPREERAQLEHHLRDCFECRRVLTELREVVSTAYAIQPEEPQQDLWNGIAVRIGAQPNEIAGFKVIDLDAHRTKDRSRRFTFSVPQLAAASVALMLLSGTVVFLALGRGASSEPVVAAAPSQDVRTVSNTQPATLKEYADAVASLEVALRQQRDRLDPVTVAVVEENLRVIDAAITEARIALERDPNSLYLNQHLESTMKRKIQLLRRAAALPGGRV